MKTLTAIPTRHPNWIDETEYLEALAKPKRFRFPLASALVFVIGLHIALVAALFASASPKPNNPADIPASSAGVIAGPKSDSISPSAAVENPQQAVAIQADAGAEPEACVAAPASKEQPPVLSGEKQSMPQPTAHADAPNRKAPVPTATGFLNPQLKAPAPPRHDAPSSEKSTTAAAVSPPVTGTIAPPKPRPTFASYKLVSGDTLYGLSRKFGVPWQEIAKANGIKDPKKLVAGQTLKMPTAKNSALK